MLRTLVALCLLCIIQNVFIVSASPADLSKRDTNACPYPFPYSEGRRSLDSRGTGNGLSFKGLQWIWSGDTSVGTRAFRKTIDTSQGNQIPCNETGLVSGSENSKLINDEMMKPNSAKSK
ncbi:hypothetical protein VKT23_018499 [Stygiomarasmius scandens]|uniref:Secreted protein n=1 Tax=Marasmiellus scandens TaxID=2682957 RepID=A0ABR1IP92_9AGAR